MRHNGGKEMTTQTDLSIPGATIREDVTVPAREPWSIKMRQGEILRIIDLEGQQAVDFLCYNADDPSDRYNAANTIKMNGNIYLGKDCGIWSVRARRLMTFIEDTCGSHDTLYGCCSVEIDDVRFGKNNDGRGCQGNFEAELAKHGMGAKDIAANINLFMYVPVEANGDVAIAPGVSKAGDYVDLLAEMDVLAVLSNCPEALNNATGMKPTPIRVVVYAL